MNLGDFDQEIIHYVGTPTNTDGEISVVYSDPTELFAKVVEISGFERYKSSVTQDLSQRLAMFTFWNFKSINPTDRIVFDNENWDVTNIRQFGRSGLTEVSCQVVK
jgi:hypothetical protein